MAAVTAVFRWLRPAAAALARGLARTPIDNRWLTGRLVEIGGNRVTVHGLTFSVDHPSIRTRDKSAVCRGLHEAAEVTLIREHLGADLPVIEVGGGIGFVSCHINRQLLDPGRHVVVEANPDLIPALETNRRLNACAFQIRSAALAYGAEWIELGVESWATGRIGGGGNRRNVPATTLAALMHESGFPRANVVMDVEGTEVDVVEREGPLLAERIRTVILETHPSVSGGMRVAKMFGALGTLGFVERARIQHVVAFDNIALAS